MRKNHELVFQLQISEFLYNTNTHH